MNNNRIISKLNQSSSTLRVIGLFLIILSFVLFIFYTKKQEISIIQQVKEINTKDSVITKLKATQNRVDTLKLILKEYLNMRANHDAYKLTAFYADTLAVYYIGLKNCKKEVVKKTEKQYWSKYKNDKFIVTAEPDVLINKTEAKAIVKGQQCTKPNKCLDEYIEIVFNDNNKIKSVRAYYAK